MIIGQITDLHLGFEDDPDCDANQLRLEAVLKRLVEFRPGLDLLLVTGDLTERGDLEPLRRLRACLEPLPFPWVVMAGNHDRRAPVLDVFPETTTHGGFLQSVLESFPLRIVLLDTVEEGRHAGAFDGGRTEWLERVLSESPERPTLLVMHHPPAPIGLDWMSAPDPEPWTEPLTALVKRRRCVIGAVAGHVHRPIVTPWAATLLRVCGSVAPQLTLDLSPINPLRPDGRPLVEVEAPEFAVHHWSADTGLTTHFGSAGPRQVLLRYEPKFQPVLQRFLRERAEPPTGGGV